MPFRGTHSIHNTCIVESFFSKKVVISAPPPPWFLRSRFKPLGVGPSRSAAWAVGAAHEPLVVGWAAPSVCVWELLTCAWLLVTPWTVAHQAPLSMGILQARILKWVAISFSRGSSWPRDWTQSPALQADFFTLWATREAPTTTFNRKLWDRHRGLLCA